MRLETSSDVSESRSPALEEVLFARPDDLTAWKVYGDWLQELGNPHGELLQVQLASPVDRQREQELIERHREQWLGALDDGRIAPRFDRGFVEAATIRGVQGSPARLADAAALPALRFLRRLSVGLVEGPLAALERFRILERLTFRPPAESLLAGLAGLHLPKLRTLRLESWPALHYVPKSRLDPAQWHEAMAAVAQMQLPALSRFEVGDAPPALLDAAIDFVAGHPTLEGATLGTVPVEELESALARLRPLLERGASVHLLVNGRGWDFAVLERGHQKTFPSLRLTSDHRQPGFHVGTPTLTEVPARAPHDFADLPERVAQAPRDRDSGIRHFSPIYVGAGWACGEYERVKRCLGCGSGEVRMIFEESSSVDGRVETYHFWKGELACRECRRFTHWEGESAT